MKYRSGGEEFEALPGDARRLTDGSWLVGNRRVRVARTAAGIEAWCDGRVWRLEKVEASRKKARAGEAGIVSPMTGKVTKVLAKVGAPVKPGDVLVIVEAMKMEYRVVAPAAGTVAEVKVKEGQLVEMGVTMIEVKS